MEFDENVLDCFLEKQLQLFPERVAETREEADNFLGECMAFVAGSLKEVWEYFEDAGTDITEMKKEDILEASEVFDIGDGRYLVVDC